MHLLAVYPILLPLILLNEISLILTAIQCLIMFFFTLGAPIWRKARIQNGWIGLGLAPTLYSGLEIIIILIQFIFAPVIYIYRYLTPLAPFILYYYYFKFEFHFDVFIGSLIFFICAILSIHQSLKGLK